jgi:hypothetical protein
MSPWPQASRTSPSGSLGRSIRPSDDSMIAAACGTNAGSVGALRMHYPGSMINGCVVVDVAGMGGVAISEDLKCLVGGGNGS